MHIKDNSQDKKYFTIIPNYIANHSTANDQALYFQMKRLAGDNEICFASEKYLKDKLGIGSKALKKSLEYLLKREWIEFAGYRDVETAGGNQQIKTYIVKDIWKMNIEHFDKGVSEREPLSKSKGVSESNQRGVQKEAKGVAFEQQRRTITNNIKKNIYFDSFWSIYPRKENKKKAQEIWKNKNLDKKYEEIISFISKAKQTDRWNKGITPHATTFLNQERWEDELDGYGKIEKKPFYRGDPMVKVRDKWKVIINGEFYEFADSEDKIIWE